MDLSILSKENRNNFINSNKSFIKKIITEMQKDKSKEISEEDLSIGIFAFNNACNSYVDSMGNFFNYSKVIIKNHVLEYLWKISNTPRLYFSNDTPEAFTEVTEVEKKAENKIYAKEVLILNKILKPYNLTYISIIKNCSYNKKIKDDILNIAFLCSREVFILNLMEEEKDIPIQKVALLTKYKVEFIERWKNYILALIIIFSNKDLLYLKAYLNINIGDKK
ncbi:hypothetical protein ACJDT4_16290 [Clostridium neuense]|uniref:RNA polymerase sigma factor SigI n=1 Tax=Clostridium neuense TaxID=1728934 RepID=A0ABW8THQ1_9CLOT